MNTINKGIENLLSVSGKNKSTINVITAVKKTPKNIQLNKLISFMNLESRFNLGMCNFSVILNKISWKKPKGHKNPQKILPNRTQKIAAIEAKEIIIGIKTVIKSLFVEFKIAKTQQTINPTFKKKPIVIPKILKLRYFLWDMINIIKICQNKSNFIGF